MQYQHPSSSTQQEPACPDCGTRLVENDSRLHCATHGHFFRYGPRLLVRVAAPKATEHELLPWQTLELL
jgi:uncharacterized Zn finger protein (UPF0148 family)